MSLTVGRHTITPVLDSVVRAPAGRLYSNTPAEAWAEHHDLLAPGGFVEMFMGGYVVHSGDRVVLVDAGVGPDGWKAPSGAVIPGGYLLDNLRVGGVPAASVTDVVFTHLHPDHIGWASRGGVPNFPNATYRCDRRDWAHFVEPGPGAGAPDVTSRDLLAPIADRFECWDGAGSLLPGIDLVDTAGHTPGSTSVVFSADDGSRAMLLGDVVHCPVELLHDEWETFGDVDPVLARQTATRLARELEGTTTVVGAAHFAGLQFGRLLGGGDGGGEPAGRRWRPLA